MNRFRQLFSTGLLAFHAAQAQPAAVTTSGEAEVQVAPDEVVLSLGVETRHKDLAAMRRANDERVKAVLAVARDTGVAARDVRTDYLNIEPEYDNWGTSRRTFLDYVQRTTVVITLRDVASFDRLLTGALQAGAEYVHGVQFRNTEMRKHRDQARALAVRAARDKAAALAGELGQKVGRPLSIQEGRSGWVGSYGGWWRGGGFSQNQAQNVMVRNGGDGAGDGDAALAPGILSVRADVTVSFELQ